MPQWKETFLIWMCFCGVLTEETSYRGGNGLPRNCYAKEVHDELLKVIDFVRAHTIPDPQATERLPVKSHQLKRFQEDEDDQNQNPVLAAVSGIGGDFPGSGSVVPTIFALIGNAIALNSSGLTESSFGLLPESVSVQITSALGSIASSILGPNVLPRTTTRGPRTPPPRRRRRTTTTMAPSSAEVTNATTELPSTTTAAVDMTTEVKAVEASNATEVAADIEVLNVTMEATTEEGPSTTEVLFKESSLGENPVYAAAYAPNYIATTSFPVYANNFLHVLYAAPTTTTVAPTSTSTASTTSTDPVNPFDYMEATGGSTGINVTEPNLTPNFTYPSYILSTPPEYSEYEYEENTEEAKSDWLVGINLPNKETSK